MFVFARQDWNRADVGEWISNIVGFPEYRSTFEVQVNGNRLMRMSANQLVSLGVRDHGHQMAIMEALRKAQEAYAEQRSTGLTPANSPRLADLPPPRDEQERMRRIRSRRLSFVDPTSLRVGGGEMRYIENDAEVEGGGGGGGSGGGASAENAHALAKAAAIAQIKDLLKSADPIDALIQTLRGIHAEDHESHVLQSLLVEQLGQQGVGHADERRRVAADGGLDLLVSLLLKWQAKSASHGGGNEVATLLEVKCCWALASLCPSCEQEFAASCGGRGFEGLVSALRTAHHETTTDSVSQALVMQVMRILKDFVKTPDVDSDDDEETQAECRAMGAAVVGFRQQLRDLGADGALQLVLERFKSDGMVQWRGGELLSMIRKTDE